MLNVVAREILSYPKYEKLSSVIQRSNVKDLIVLNNVVSFVKNKLNKNDIIMGEIGCFMGESSNEFANAVNTLYCVDAWDENVLVTEDEKMKWRGVFQLVEEVFDEVCNMNKNIIKKKNESIIESKEYEDGFFDFVYIDAEHTYESVKNDILAWKSKTNKYIGGHDYCDRFSGVVKAVDEILGKPLIIFSDTSWICEVK